MPITPILAVLLQVGPNPSPDSVASAIPRSPREETVTPVEAEPARPVVPNCPLDSGADPEEVARIAVQRAQLSSGTGRLAAIQCLAMAQAQLEQWDEAAAGFAEARTLAAGLPEWQARLGTQRAHALAEAAQVAEARKAFETAIADAVAAGDSFLAGQIAADQAVVEVAAGDSAAAARTLAAARERSPEAHRVWLLSATLARRDGDLGQAQAFIEQAAERNAADPEVGLEAGVIAALAGRYDAARASFASVVDLPQAGAAADTARDYLAQLENLEPSAQ